MSSSASEPNLVICDIELLISWLKYRTTALFHIPYSLIKFCVFVKLLGESNQNQICAMKSEDFTEKSPYFRSPIIKLLCDVPRNYIQKASRQYPFHLRY